MWTFEAVKIRAGHFLQMTHLLRNSTQKARWYAVESFLYSLYQGLIIDCTTERCPYDKTSKTEQDQDQMKIQLRLSLSAEKIRAAGHEPKIVYTNLKI